MHTKFHTTLFRNAKVLGLGIAAVVGSFSLGIQSAGDVQPIALIEAGSLDVAGDMDGSGDLGIEDVTIILEIVQGYRAATPLQRLADPNHDGHITVDDALALLTRISQ